MNLSSPSRKRGSRGNRSALGALGSRFRGNDGFGWKEAS